MIYISHDKNNLKNPLNNIKRCQYCSEVWIKVSGCQDKTTCGNFPDTYDEKGIFEDSKLVKYEFSWVNN